MGRKSLFRKLILTALAATMLVTGLAGNDDSAEAWRTIKKSGVTGRVAKPQVQFWRETIPLICPGPGGTHVSCPFDQLNVTTTDVLRVRRAPRKGRQVVAVVYGLQRWNGSKWVTHSRSKTFVRRIGHQQKLAKIPQWNTRPSTTKGHWRMTYAVAWGRPDGRVLGSRLIGPSKLYEQYCYPTQVRCIYYPKYTHVLSL